MSKEVFCTHGFKVVNGKARSCFAEDCKKGEFKSVYIHEYLTAGEFEKHYPELSNKLKENK